ncbi:hypothetical protein FACS1894137_18400 [Spirochaetia bacterium]|nr:hypothetical protein FACS1894137_18400 [Spirochaetia bacterium]
MPDFTNLDPTTMAQSWIYVVGFFIFGVIIGWVLRRGFMKHNDDAFKSDKEKFEKERTKLLETVEKYEELKKNVEKSDEYWLYERSKKSPPNRGA